MVFLNSVKTSEDMFVFESSCSLIMQESCSENTVEGGKAFSWESILKWIKLLSPINVVRDFSKKYKVSGTNFFEYLT